MKDKLKDKMKKKFTDLSISHKMLMVYITFASAFLLIALGLTQISFRIYSKELYDKSLQELDYFSQNVNRGLKDAERNNYSISMDALVQRTLSDLSVLEYPSLDYNQKIRDLRRILLNEYDPESCVKSIIFVDLYGNTVEVGTAAWDVSGESFTAIKKQMEQGKGAYTTYGPTEECPYLLSGRVVRNRLDMSLSDMGKLIFVCDVGNVISENKESLSSNKAAIYVYNKNLIVDDEQIEREGMAHFIQWDKYDIQLCGTAWNGADALGKIQKDVPDIVLTDIKMPVMNGIELIQKLSETYRNIVVVVLSGYGEYEFTSQAMEYGIRHYILKPCDEDKIVAVMNDAKKEVDKRREYHTLKRELLPHAKEELFRRLLTGSRLSDDEIMALKKDFPANGDSYRLLAMKNEVSGFEYIEQFILGNILGEILQMATMPLFTYVDDMVIFAIDVCTDNSLSKAVERTLQEFARMKSKAIASAASLEGDISVAHELYKQLLYLFTMVDNKTDAGLLCYPTQNEAESNTYYFDFDRLKSSDRYDNILFEITLAMKKLQSIGLSNDEKQRIFEAFIVTWSSYVGSEKLKLLNIGGINSDESAITEVSRWIAETLNIYETGKEKERMEKILDVIYSNFDNTELNIQYIAKNILFMNEDYFGRVFIRNMHLKFSAYLEQSRIEMAKRLLEYNPDMRIAMLTELIGYPADGQYFSKTFRKVCGMTPTEYRENLKKTDI